MKFLRSGKEIKKELLRLISSCTEMRWAVAWASVGNECFEELRNNKDKIGNLYVGIQFYQTHPDFLDEFVNNQKVKVVKNTSGVFHPKAFLFLKGSDEWECIIGSPNFTTSAFTANDEVAVLITNLDNSANIEYRKINSVFKDYDKLATEINKEFAQNYRNIWEKQQRRIKRLSGQFDRQNKTHKSKSPIDSVIFSMSWEKFVEKVRNDPSHSVKGRLALMAAMREFFYEYQDFESMPRDVRAKIAGFITKKKDIDWGFFGSTSGSGVFKNRIVENDPNISLALDFIPKYGQVNRIQFSGFLENFYCAFTEKRNYLGSATRLLAMKRPDYFVCLTGDNKGAFCKDFDITRYSLTLDNYWDEVVERIKECVWWREDEPNDRGEKAVWQARAAFLDSIYHRAPKQ